MSSSNVQTTCMHLTMNVTIGRSLCTHLQNHYTQLQNHYTELQNVNNLPLLKYNLCPFREYVENTYVQVCQWHTVDICCDLEEECFWQVSCENVMKTWC